MEHTHNNKTRSAALSIAWNIRKTTGASWGDCQRKAWAALRLKAQLRTGACTFSYVKENGETRKATGTLCPDLFTYSSKGDAKPGSPAVIRYFDLDANGFRSFRIDRLTLAA